VKTWFQRSLANGVLLCRYAPVYSATRLEAILAAVVRERPAALVAGLYKLKSS
jgi:hypothetical protein